MVNIWKKYCLTLYKPHDIFNEQVKGIKRCNEKFDTSCYEWLCWFINAMSVFHSCVKSTHKISMSIFSNLQDIWIITRKWNHNFKLFWKNWVNYMWNGPEGPFQKYRNHPSPPAICNVTSSRSNISLYSFCKGYQIWNAEASTIIAVKRYRTLGCYFSRLQHLNGAWVAKRYIGYSMNFWLGGGHLKKGTSYWKKGTFHQKRHLIVKILHGVVKKGNFI